MSDGPASPSNPSRPSFGPETVGNAAAAGVAGAWRALDASANRAAEALRVIEDALRFVLDDPHLTGVAKQLRHDLAAVLAHGDLAGRLALRDVAGDVGPSVVAAGALPRATPADLLAANAARGAQALRSLQECSLLLCPAQAVPFERLRYRLYELERAAVGTARSRDRLDGVSLCVLVDGRDDERSFATLVGGLLEAGVRMIQIRDKSLPVPLLASRARLAVHLARRTEGALVIVNDRPDVAVAVGADGVHGGADDLPLELVRRVTGPSAIVGRTAHDPAAAEAAVLGGADYLGVGPCFPSTTKTFDRQAPTAFLAGVAGSIALPTFAIGGVTLERLPTLRSLGLHRVAVAAAITGAADPAAAAAEFIARLAEPERVAGTP